MAKKRATKSFPGDESVVIELAGRKVKGISRKFKIENDEWIVCALSDGSRVKLRFMVEQIVITEEDITPGIPQVVVRQGTIVAYEPPKKK
jgi:hypothetical protein